MEVVAWMLFGGVVTMSVFVLVVILVDGQRERARRDRVRAAELEAARRAFGDGRSCGGSE